MDLTRLIANKAELTDGGHPAEAIVLSTRIRLARNIAPHPFPGWAKPSQRLALQEQLLEAVGSAPSMSAADRIDLRQLGALERLILVERRLISRELSEAKEGAGVVVSADQSMSVMINEEDHLRLQAVSSGFNFDSTWEAVDALDDALEEQLDFAFSPELGYLTACPTNLGTGMRASAMLHLPGLVIQDHIEKVVRMVNQLGMAVRGHFGEGSEATGSIFQISNQQTLGESEDSIIERLRNVLRAIIEQEENARLKILEEKPHKLFDKMGRAFGILQNGHLLSSDEAMNLLSLMRLAVDLGILPSGHRAQVDRLLMETQPGHIQYSARHEIEPDERDHARANRMRLEYAKVPALNFDVFPNRG
ncbi:MAG: protein arginine kinase [Opitutales bacterium]